jgi:hypothetical protein
MFGLRALLVSKAAGNTKHVSCLAWLSRDGTIFMVYKAYRGRNFPVRRHEGQCGDGRLVAKNGANLTSG